jgi:hypothetical protein
MKWHLLVAVAFALATSAHGQDAPPTESGPQVEALSLWGGREPPPGTIIEFSLEGVVLEDPFGVRRTVRWDFVREVHGPKATKAEPFMRIARLAWRARTRLERGDAVTAEPIFEELYPLYEGLRGEMASMIAEGLLRCRLRRSAQTGAVRPWLSYLVSEGAGPYRSRLAGALRPAVDENLGLVPSLAPVWLNTPAVEAFARSEPIVVWEQQGATAPRRAELLEALYRHAARFECELVTGAPDLSISTSDLADEGIRLVHAMVVAESGSVEERAAARKELEAERNRARRAGSSRAWVEAWCRLGLGRSLLREPDREQRRLGVIELLHLPARFGTSQPYLAGVALAEAAVALNQLGDAHGADSLLMELRDSYGAHPATTWEPVRSLLDQLNTSAGQ